MDCAKAAFDQGLAFKHLTVAAIVLRALALYYLKDSDLLYLSCDDSRPAMGLN